MAKQKLTLNIGEEYRIEIYPSKDIANGIYLGNGGLDNSIRHILLAGNGERRLVLMDAHWTIRDGEILTYSPISSVPVDVLSEENFAKLDGNQQSKLIKLLVNAGALQQNGNKK